MNLLSIKDFIWSVFHLPSAIAFKKRRNQIDAYCKKMKGRAFFKRKKVRYPKRKLLKDLYDSLLSLGKPRYKQKEELAFQIEKYIQSEIYRKSLIVDGQEQDEIEEQMLIADEHLNKRAKIYMYQTFTRELVFDTYDKTAQDKIFFSSVEYYRKHIEDFDFKSYIDKYFETYGMTEMLPELILRASIRNDTELENVLSQYYKQ